MTLETCIEIGKECDLTTLAQYYDNIELHATSLFKYEDIYKELLELQKDFFSKYPDHFCELFNATKEELIEKGWKII